MLNDVEYPVNRKGLSIKDQRWMIDTRPIGNPKLYYYIMLNAAFTYNNNNSINSWFKISIWVDNETRLFKTRADKPLIGVILYKPCLSRNDCRWLTKQTILFYIFWAWVTTIMYLCINEKLVGWNISETFFPCTDLWPPRISQAPSVSSKKQTTRPLSASTPKKYEYTWEKTWKSELPTTVRTNPGL